MNIVVLDGYTLNPGDLSWDGLRMFGDLKVYDRTPREKIIERSKDADIILTNKTVLDADILKSLTHLKYIGILATGCDDVDTEFAGQMGIIVSNIPSYGTNSVAQLTFALILELCHRVQRQSDLVMEGKWSKSMDFTYNDFSLIELASKNIGIIGLGDIGRKVSEIAQAFGMRVLASDKFLPENLYPAGVTMTSLNELLSDSDIVTLHCPLTEETSELINIKNLRLMKPTAFLINTSRGQIIVEEDLAQALNEGIIAGAGLDVLSVEPPSADNPLLQAKNCIITPHIGWATHESRSRLMDTAVCNIKAFLAGSPVNVVS
ncbi:MAG TPA: D-2-hydroxyacid dehydrogenase [Bacteroidales bacterium]|nr:D-2-hydroxyacid dehydrogenase [Bacteroidales bacterium]